MKPSAWRASATFVILLYLYVLAVQEIVGEHVDDYVRTHHRLDEAESTYNIKVGWAP